eukprot:jgi/Mesvir1/2208/Mv09853-RA.1
MQLGEASRFHVLGALGWWRGPRIGRDANGKASGNVVENTAVETSSQESLPINLLQGTAKGAKAVPSGDTTPPWIGRMDNRDDEQGSPRSSTSVAPSPAPAKPWIPSKASASHTLSTSEHHARQSDRPLGPASPTPPVDTPARRSVRAPDFTRKERRSDDSRRWRIVAGQQPLEMVAFLRQRIKASRWLGGKAVEELDPEELSELVVEMDVLRESLQACSYLRRSPLVLASCRQPVRLSREGGGLKTQSMEEELRLQLQQRTVAQAMTRAVVGDAVGMEGHSGLAAHMMGVEEALREASGGANVDAKESALAQAIYQLEHGGEQVEAIAAVAERAAVMESVLRGVPRIAQVAALERELEGMEMRAAASGDAMLCRMMEEKQAMLEEALVDMEASMGVIPSKAQLDDLVAALDMLEAKLGADPDQASAAMEHWSAALGVAEWLWIERVEQKCEELRNTTGFLQQLYASFDRDLDERC